MCVINVDNYKQQKNNICFMVPIRVTAEKNRFYFALFSCDNFLWAIEITSTSKTKLIAAEIKEQQWRSILNRLTIWCIK